MLLGSAPITWLRARLRPRELVPDAPRLAVGVWLPVNLVNSRVRSINPNQANVCARIWCRRLVQVPYEVKMVIVVLGKCLRSKQMLPCLLCMAHMPSDRVCGVSE